MSPITDCHQRITGKLHRSSYLATELNKELQTYRQGDPRVVVLMQGLRDVYQTGVQELQELKRMSEELNGGGAHWVGQVEATLRKMDAVIQDFAGKFNL